jgi:uncharacterized protein
MGSSQLPPAAAWRHHTAREGFETVVLASGPGGLHLRGATTAVEEGVGWFVQYEIVVDDDWCTQRAEVSSSSERGSYHCVVERIGSGGWRVDGQERSDLAGCRDVDLESSACTNAMPVHRMQLVIGQQRDAPAVYVRAVDMTVERLEQRYRRLTDDGGHMRYHYESPRFAFEADLAYDEWGLVVDYPGIATRVY